MKDVNAAGTFYYSIWDAGGNDTILYTGAKNTTIDLRAATLQYEVGGGGNVSYAHGIFGGFTIANGVVIENATSGDGNDTLTGNAANNVMTSGAGNDSIYLFDGGDDTVVAGAGNDTIYFNGTMTAADKVNGGEGSDRVILFGNYASGLTFAADSLVGVETLQLITGSRVGSEPFNYNLTMNDGNVGPGGMLITAVSLGRNESFTLNGKAELDGAFRVLSGAGDDLIGGGQQGDRLHGGLGNDRLFGYGGDDILIGGAGTDQLRGGLGADTFQFEAASDSAAGAADTILDFQPIDKIDLLAVDANSTVDGNQAFDFIGTSAFSNVAGQLRTTYDAGTKQWKVEGDTDGNGEADFAILVTRVDTGPMVISDFLL
jgi:Ca2+-binding RTX toxin-like protein